MAEKLADIISIMNKIANGKVTKRQKYMYQMKRQEYITNAILVG